MIFAAIDIGSNAVRLQITNVIRYGDSTTFKKLEFVRFPLRLGGDVFTQKRIGEQRESDFVKLMQAYKILIDLYKVDEYYACATSAMREAENGQELANRVWKEVGLKINIISGDQEADLINKVISYHLGEDQFIHIDVGGGSTELNLYNGYDKIAAKSFPIGSVRLLNDKDRHEAWEEMYEWIDKYVDSKKEIKAIGTGGNIKKLFEVSSGQKGEFLSIKTMESCLKDLTKMDYEERMHKLQMNADRADVIIPASGIYINAMKRSGAQKILVPDVGLKDGIMAYLYEKNISTAGLFSFRN
ncbi:Ppx/GppA phosphatase family protein [Reichenbachiella versicolor]|uniref:Ppx/GppA phosphatase family protein n=1 Tax=Reichenbachiella versicolor TaxID=1821036 RepID=UPI000D6E274E|nr:phosphatase [Reichenbachiella versicolor]